MQERIKADNLCKRYGSLTALDQASLTAYSSECLGIFGLSNAGKSALLRLLAGMESPDSGMITSTETGAAIALQSPANNSALTPSEIMLLWATLYGIPCGKRRAAVRETLALVGLDSERDRRIGTLSAGVRKLVELARALISPSNLLLLDEPMVGLDSDMRRRIWEHLLKIRSYDHKTIIIATSRSEDAELCDRIILLHEGRVLAAGTPVQLRGLVGPEAMTIKPVSTRGIHSNKAGWSGMIGREQDGSLVVELDAGSRPTELLRQISTDVAAVRFRSRGMDSVLDELLSRPELLSSRDG